MRIAIWKTGHEIADKVAEALLIGLPNSKLYNTKDILEENYEGNALPQADLHVGYGILRGCTNVFRLADKQNIPWFNIDRGYLYPNHYDGYYRISLRGTQHTQAIQSWMLDEFRLHQLPIKFEPWRGLDSSKETLVCPPTDYVAEFFGMGKWPEGWYGLKTGIIRTKDCQIPLNDQLNNCNYVSTFNSSVGWEALRQGIPCWSQPNHSLIGNYFIPKDPYETMSLDMLSEFQDKNRRPLFAAMANLQLTLKEIKQGKLWPLMQRLLMFT